MVRDIPKCGLAKDQPVPVLQDQVRAGATLRELYEAYMTDPTRDWSSRTRLAYDIVHLKLQIAKLRRERFGSSSERTVRLLDQLELQLEELEASASEDELAAEIAAAKTTKVERSGAIQRGQEFSRRLAAAH
jgi:hypothetical protein